MLAGMPISRCARSIAVTALPERGAGPEIERQRHRRELPGVIDHEPRLALLDASDAQSGTCWAADTASCWPAVAVFRWPLADAGTRPADCVAT